MRVLVYGAGVLGCLLAHRLQASGRAEVTLLARGAWANALERDGLTIRHVLQRRTTTDRVHIVRELAPDDAYDLAFVVLQAGQVPDVLPAMAAASAVRRVVFVGNNADARGTAARLTELEVQRPSGASGAAPAPCEVAFAFQSTGGRREAGQVVSMYARLGMTLGGADGSLSGGFRRDVEGLLAAAGYRVTREDQMDAWLKCHLAFILPIAFVSYACGCDLRRATRAQRRAILDACREGYALLAARSIPIRPAGDEAYLEPGPRRALLAAMVLVMAKTPLGRLAATDHCTHAVAEMRDLTHAFGRLRTAVSASDTVPRFAAPAARNGSSCPDLSAKLGEPLRSDLLAASAQPLRPDAPAVPDEPPRPNHTRPGAFAMLTWDALRAQMPSWDDLLVDPRCASHAGNH